MEKLLNRSDPEANDRWLRFCSLPSNRSRVKGDKRTENRMEPRRSLLSASVDVTDVRGRVRNPDKPSRASGGLMKPPARALSRYRPIICTYVRYTIRRYRCNTARMLDRIWFAILNITPLRSRPFNNLSLPYFDLLQCPNIRIAHFLNHFEDYALHTAPSSPETDESWPLD